MNELWRHIGADTDVPAGDIGVGGREIGFLYGQYKKLNNTVDGTFTGKGLNWGGSLIRPEATGYGCVYFAQEMLKTRNESFAGKKVAISGSGNVAQYAVQKCLHLGAIPVTLSDSSGWIYDKEGINLEKLAYVLDLKNHRRGRIREYSEKFKGVEYHESGNVWQVPCEVALPCATQNEIDGEDAKTLINNGCYCVSEGANMPTTPDGVEVFIHNKTLYGPGKAANAGGVAVSGLEMCQNSMRLKWSREEVDNKLQSIMKSIHETCWNTAEEFGTPGNYVNGANIGGFIKVADAMVDLGVI